MVFPFVLLRLRPSTLRWALLLTGGMWMLALVAPVVMVSTPGHSGDQMFVVKRLPPFALPEFMAGISLGWIHLRFRPSARLAAGLAVAGVVLFAGTLAAVGRIPELLLHNGLLIPIYGLLILGLAQQNVLSRLLSHPALILLGEASFALYLTHFMFDDWMRVDFGVAQTIGALWWKLAILIPVAILLHLFVEKPGRRLILAWWQRGQSKWVRVESAR